MILLRNVLDDERRRRTIEILKFRGTAHQKGQFPFTIVESGVHVVPLSAIELKQHSTDLRISRASPSSTRCAAADSSATRSCSPPAPPAAARRCSCRTSSPAPPREGEKTVLFAFEESREQLFRNAAGWGIDFEQFERDGLLVVRCTYPETAGLEDHLLRIKETIAEFQPDRVAVDSLSALERISTERSFREFVLGLTSHIKSRDMAGLFTSTTSELFGGTSITEAHISTITDSIILLRYVEQLGEMRRAITVLKMRGSAHDTRIRDSHRRRRACTSPSRSGPSPASSPAAPQQHRLRRRDARRDGDGNGHHG